MKRVSIGGRVVAVLVTLATLVLATLVLAGPASAHVTVSSSDATQGGFGVLTFRVPTESDTLSTTELAVQLPAATPIATVSVQPIPGWTVKTVTSKLAAPIKNDDGDTVTEAVSEVDWTADSAATAIKPGQFQEFSVEAGPLPKVASLRFGALQTYSDGRVVKWIESPAPGSSVEPENPAPVLTLAPAGALSATASSGGAAASKPAGNTGPIVLSVIALVVAAGALGVAFVSRAKRGGP